MFIWEILKGEDTGCTIHEQNMEELRQALVDKGRAEQWAAREELEGGLAAERRMIEPIIIDMEMIEEGNDK